MKICRFDTNRIGIVLNRDVADVTAAVLPHLKPEWPMPKSDLLIAALPSLRPAIEAALPTAPRIPLNELALQSPVANPPKIVAAPVNYRKHVEESVADPGIHYGSEVKNILTAGLFLKANTSLIGAGETVKIRFPDRRNDHEIELAVIIGRTANRVTRAEALSYVAGYSIGLDITVRGPEDRSFRKSPNSYTVLGPWLVTADEFGNPADVDMQLKIGGEVRQRANTRDLIIDVPGLIEFASSFYTLYPGDILITGTPEGVGPIVAGDTIDAHINRIGSMRVAVA